MSFRNSLTEVLTALQQIITVKSYVNSNSHTQFFGWKAELRMHSSCEKINAQMLLLIFCFIALLP